MAIREVIFRGKRTDNGEWIYGDLIQNVDCIKIREQEKDINRISKSFEIVPETVGQYTNFSDKNGKKIFEGDIIQTLMIEYNPPRQYRKPYQVNYNSDFPSVVVEHYSPFEHFTEKVEYEVIGNIHDNPELIKGGAE